MLEVLDIGAAQISEVPVYKSLIDFGLAHLNAFEGDQRQHESIRSRFGLDTAIFGDFLFDGSETTVYLAAPITGMTSLFKPDPRALAFFNGFTEFGKIHSEERIQTTRLDDVKSLPPIDFIKMDVQGSELTILQNGTNVLRNCLAVQLEVSFICLYQDQPSFGEVDQWMRSQGFVPHSFLHLKRWSISPTIFDGNFRVGGNQLLEADVIYVRDPLSTEVLSTEQLKKLALTSHYALGSIDLCGHWLIELSRRRVLPPESHMRYLENLRNKHGHPLTLT